ncbi:uncharacterized protein N7459_000524 [Penicillium hispanicum]|uniref:uncharacterized protein n=1 Tax=Penicillium hispanicum TaxID=1080232 RepID=UPI002541C9E1|nr:uncharacterized protein N7459_000524 [Penicillium hispanicum]KAJ5594316.1 hypothetical protein N7459_000524 [Penicillium hispanicum]
MSDQPKPAPSSQDLDLLGVGSWTNSRNIVNLPDNFDGLDFADPAPPANGNDNGSGGSGSMLDVFLSAPASSQPWSPVNRR